ERVWNKATAFRATDRYEAAQEFATDLRFWLRHQSSAAPSALADSSPRHIVPRGLRAFRPEDADFFLDLLPGPRSRAGLPERIEFWKTRLESRDADTAFRVGVIYGPSGCGKSSLVRAGLLPRLAKNVIDITLEATPDDTEKQLRQRLQKRFPALDAQTTLAEQ